MFWPFPNTHIAIRQESKDGEDRYLVFPKEVHPAWFELAVYLDNDFRPEWMIADDKAMQEEFQGYPSADVFYHQSKRYLFHLTTYFLEGWKRTGYAFLMEVMARDHRQTILDYGCGIGSDGLWFMENGMTVNFADYANPCRDYLAWRLARRMMTGASTIYDVENDVIPPHDIVWCMDVLEHLPPAQHVSFLDHLATLGRFVILNLVVDNDADGTVHHPVDAPGLTAYLQEHWQVVYRDIRSNSVDGNLVRFVTYWKQDAGISVHDGWQDG